MPAKAHALLSSSSSSRWLNCPPSARLCEEYDDVTSEFALEGTDAHELCEYRLRKSLGQEVSKEEPNLTYFSEEMSDCANSYVSYITELLTEIKKSCKDPVVLVEQTLDYSKYVPEGFGTGDCIICADKVLHVIDYKHGKGVEVSADHNSQMFLYALGALELFDCLYEIETISMTIFQPRLHNLSTFEISVSELKKWANDVLVPTAQLAWEGKGEFKCGAHCKFCKAKANCIERAKAHMKLLDYDYAAGPLLSDAEVEDVLDKVDTLVSWASDIKDFALAQALAGKHYERWKAVEGRSTRKITDENAVIEAVANIGLDPFEKKLLSLGELQKKLGKAKFIELVEPHTTKPQGKPTLVPRDDKREEINTAASDFSGLDNEN